MFDCVSITEVTVAAGWIAGLAILALIATGWRKTARATADPARARRPQQAEIGVEVVDLPAPIDRPTPIWRRLVAALGGTTLAVFFGAVTATFLGFGVAYAIITLTHMLKR